MNLRRVLKHSALWPHSLALGASALVVMLALDYVSSGSLTWHWAYGVVALGITLGTWWQAAWRACRQSSSHPEGSPVQRSGPLSR